MRDDTRIKVRVNSPWQIVGAAISAAITTVVLGALLVLVIIPKLSGGAALTVLTGSMEPTFKPGDVVVVEGVKQADVCTAFSVGDIVTYFPKPSDPVLISHRVVAKTIGDFDDGTSCRLVTQGDNNSSTDEPISPAQVRGKFMYGVPKLGYVKQWMGDHPQTLIMVAAGALIVYGLWSTCFARPKTRVVTIPGRGAADGAATQAHADHELRSRELDLREREIACREAELALAVRPGATADAVPVPAAEFPAPREE